MADHVWVVSQWEWGGGGDDDRQIRAVCTTSEKAYDLAAQLEKSGERHDLARVDAFPLDELVPLREADAA